MTNETEIILAPAAGSGIGRLLAAALLAKPDLVDGMVAVIDRGFDAHRMLWSQSQKDWIREDDTKTQIATLGLVLAHMEGEPIKRIIHQHLGGTGTIDPLAALQESPALREAARHLLDKAEWAEKHDSRAGRARRAQAAAAVEVEPAASPPGPTATKPARTKGRKRTKAPTVEFE